MPMTNPGLTISAYTKLRSLGKLPFFNSYRFFKRDRKTRYCLEKSRPWESRYIASGAIPDFIYKMIIGGVGVWCLYLVFGV